MDVTSWLLFTSVLVNQMGRVLIPAIKTTVIADPVMGSEFKDKVGMFLSGVSIVCLGGKLLGAAVTDKLGGWLILIAVFAIWIVATGGAVVAQSVDVFGYAWLLNSFAYTITWGAVLQVIGATYTNDSEKTAQLTFASSASRFGATIGNIVYGQLLTAGFGWRQVCMPMIPLQALLLLLVIYKWNSATPAAAPKPATPKAGEAPAPPKTSAFGAMLNPKPNPDPTLNPNPNPNPNPIPNPNPNPNLSRCHAQPRLLADAHPEDGAVHLHPVLHELHPAAAARGLWSRPRPVRHARWRRTGRLCRWPAHRRRLL